MPRGKRTPPRAKAAVIAGLLTGDGVRETARNTGVSAPTVCRIAEELKHDGTGKPWDYESLVADYTAVALHMLTRQLELFGDLEWLRQQPASEVATLHGVAVDKVVRILASWERATANTQPRPAIDGIAEPID